MKAILSIFVTIVFLAGSIGLTLNTHYCGGHISDTQLGLSTIDLGCGMENDSKPSCENTPTSIKSNCCSDGHQSILISDEFNVQTELIEIDQQLVLLFATTFFDLYSFETEKTYRYQKYTPPDPKKDIPVLIQSFLI